MVFGYKLKELWNLQEKRWEDSVLKKIKNEGRD